MLQTSSVDLGRFVAEDDPRLDEYYVERSRYLDRALAHDDPGLLYVGPKGVGKSAILQMIRIERRSDEKRIVSISPDDLAFSALANVKASTPILSEAHQNQWLFTSLWDYILSIEILRREYPNQNLLSSALVSIFGSEHDKEAKKLLKISIDDAGSPRTLTQRILELINEVELSASIGGNALRASIRTDGTNTSEQLKLLSQVNYVAKNLPGKLSHPYYILIDDLDLHWVDSPVQNEFIAALILSLRKLSRPPNLKIIVALRDDILRKLPLQDKDKLRDRICVIKWDKHAVQSMVTERVRVLMRCANQDIWDRLFPAGSFDLMWDHSKGLPRELIRMAMLALTEAKSAGHGHVMEDDLRIAIVDFSKQRLEEIESEHRHQFPGLAALARRFRGWPKEFPYRKLEEEALSIAADVDSKAQGATKYTWAGGYLDNPLGLAQALLETGFLLYKPSRTARAVEYGDELDVELSTNAWFAIHQVYAAGLGLIGDL